MSLRPRCGIGVVLSPQPISHLMRLSPSEQKERKTNQTTLSGYCNVGTIPALVQERDNQYIDLRNCFWALESYGYLACMVILP